ncbi:MAG: type II secretion system protein [Candidatus Berkelbacteria bacterium]|nr:type II secretion system protein [Candidatus Berkelbacteria bacterium]
MRRNNTQEQKGFTLLELLIASAIFAVTIVLIVGSFGISTKYQREIRINRDVSQDIRYVTQEIAQQVEFSFNGPMKTTNGNLITQNINNINNNVYNFAVVAGPGTDTTGNDMMPQNTLYIRGSDNHCRYYTTEKVNNIKRVVVYIDKNERCENPDFRGPYFLTDEKVNINSLQFRGVMNQKDKNKQAYVWIIINSNNNRNFSEFNIPMHSSTLATIRNYNREK